MRFYKELLLLLFASLLFSSCSQKSYFNFETRKLLNEKSITLDKIQFYIDKDVEIRRELTSGDTKVSSGKIKLENGKKINIVYLKKNTPGICVKSIDNIVYISFEVGDNKFLKFGAFKSGDTYQILGADWNKSTGKTTYEGQTYYIQPGGNDAKLMIKKSVIDKLEVKKRKMKGRKLE
jgi:hypothetical protein